jgi:hypothetical protein
MSHLITADVVAHSVNPEGQEIVSMVVEQPKFINAEVNTHRVFSRNGSSSRAIPTQSAISLLGEKAYYPMDVRLNQSGMQGRTQVPTETLIEFHEDLQDLLHYTQRKVEKWSDKDGMNIHKQHTVRYLEPFLMQKFLITSTEWDNWYDLRIHEAAQPEIALLATRMKEALESSHCKKLNYGDWHLPFSDDLDKEMVMCSDDRLYPNGALVSAGRCAGISYRAVHTVDKAQNLSSDLLSYKHVSPFEHQATPLLGFTDTRFNPLHIRQDQAGNVWGGNLKGWGQLRGMLV